MSQHQKQVFRLFVALVRCDCHISTVAFLFLFRIPVFRVIVAEELLYKILERNTVRLPILIKVFLRFLNACIEVCFRRKNLQTIIDRLEDIKADLEEITYEEEEYRDNIPENFQSSEKYERADEACDNLNDAADTLNEVIDSITTAME